MAIVDLLTRRFIALYFFSLFKNVSLKNFHYKITKVSTHTVVKEDFHISLLKNIPAYIKEFIHIGFGWSVSRHICKIILAHNMCTYALIQCKNKTLH